MLEVTLYTIDDQGELDTSDDSVFEVKFASLVNSGTYGPPPLVAPSKEGRPLAQIEDEVLYINTSVVPAFTIKRISDD